jgi:hypothetical protein
MHVHPNQLNPNAQLDAIYAAERAAAKRAAEGTRRKLMESASAVAGAADSEEDCVVRLGSREGSGEPAQQQDQRNQDGRKKQKQQSDAAETDGSISDWA